MNDILGKPCKEAIEYIASYFKDNIGTIDVYYEDGSETTAFVGIFFNDGIVTYFGVEDDEIMNIEVHAFNVSGIGHQKHIELYLNPPKEMF